MTDELPPAQRIKLAWLIGVVAAFAIFALIAAYSSRMTNDYPDYDQQRAEVRYDTLKKVQDTENALIEPKDDQGNPGAEWIDQGKGTVRIPIEVAMAKQVELLKSQAPAPGAEIPGSAPAVKPAPATMTGASTNAAPATPAAPTSTNAAPTTPAKPKANPAASTPPKKSDAKVKPASPAAPTGTPTAPQAGTPNK